jgi:hypothetical protein
MEELSSVTTVSLLVWSLFISIKPEHRGLSVEVEIPIFEVLFSNNGFETTIVEKQFFIGARSIKLYRHPLDGTPLEG